MGGGPPPCEVLMVATTEDTAVIRTVGLTKVFHDFWHRPYVKAVDALDLEVRPNEVFGLLGPNGSGKSTTIKMLLGLLYPTRGRILVLGRRPTDVAVKRRIGYLPEESYLYRFLNARETLDYYGRLFHLPRHERRRRTEMLLEMVGLQAVARRRIGEYSKGMQRRIGLAQALINDPDLLLLDEPTTGLDPIGTREMKDLIATLARRGKTVLVCSHLLADVEDVCDRVSILYGGRQHAEGDIDTLLRRTDRTQITVPRLSEATLQRLRDLVASAEGSDVEVAAPRQKLEDYFLDIVRQAQASEADTSGAVAGGAVPEFLSGAAASPQRVIEDLVAAGREAPAKPGAAADVPQVERLEPERGEVIERLVTAGEEPSEPVDEDRQTARPSRPPAPGGDLIDELVQRGKEESQHD